ncbi:MAG: IS110 family transposase [Nitrospirae bacterium]|nr:MAG: IS110 family transposase [Nitrospirota bacterium]
MKHQDSEERSRVMLIIGCDFHSRFQQIAMLDTDTGEITERRLEHGSGEARAFYVALPGPARVGMEATGYARWFERMLAQQGHELWIGDAAEIRARMVRQQKTDARDARHILQLLAENRFPRIYVSKPEDRDIWQLLRHRDKLVHWQTSIRNQLHALAMGEGLCRKKRLWTQRGRQELQALSLDSWATRRRNDLIEILDRLRPAIEELDQAVQQQAQQRPAAVLLMRQPGVGPVTSLAFTLMVGPVQRFATSRELVSYVGLNPSEDSSGGRQRLGAISKQGNSMVRWLLLQAAQTASRSDVALRRHYQRLVVRRGRAIAKVAIARKLAVRLYWMLRQAAKPNAADSHAG